MWVPLNANEEGSNCSHFKGGEQFLDESTELEGSRQKHMNNSCFLRVAEVTEEAGSGKGNGKQATNGDEILGRGVRRVSKC